MANCEQDDKMDFTTLITKCAGPDGKEQEAYLVRLVAKLMIGYFGRDPSLPDVNVLRAMTAKGIVNEVVEKDVFAAIKVLDTFYGMIARAFLDDPDFDPSGIRSDAIKFMRKELRERRAVQQGANI